MDTNHIAVSNDELLSEYLAHHESTAKSIMSLNDEFLTEYVDNDQNDIATMNDAFLAHYGLGHDDDPPGRGSGRYPYGSGENPGQHQLYSLNKEVNEARKRLRAEGITNPDPIIAKGLKFNSTTEMRQAMSIENDRRKKWLSVAVPEYKAKGLSVKEISKRTGYSETTIRKYLDDQYEVNYSQTAHVADMLREQVDKKRYIDYGAGSEYDLPNGIGTISRERMKTAIKMLEEEGYKIHKVKVPQVSNPGQFTTISVLGAPDTEWREVKKDPSLIQPIQATAIADTGKTVLGMLPVESIDSKRVFIRYTDQNGKGGAEQEGLIELRRGVEDISLGPSTYAQVRIGVDGTHYMKGMAVYSDTIPDGYDVVYNTNKKIGTDKYDVYKPMKTIIKYENGKKVDTGIVDQDNPFGASIKDPKLGGQSYCLDQNGNKTDKLRVINKVNDQGDWEEWSKTLSPQMLSKQPTPLVKSQLDVTYKSKLEEFNEICNLTNPVVKRNQLESFASDCDASASHLKAKAFTGQGSFAIIPIPTLEGGTEKYRAEHGVDGEVYAPRYKDGEQLALIRYPHAGQFEIPILRVNNSNALAKSRIGNAPDAIGINAATASRLSGADFDGDTVAVIPLSSAKISNQPALKELVGFDTKVYKFNDPNAPGIKPQTKQNEMGKITNLIADMGAQGADEKEMARAVKHSMVVVDAEKHHLDWKQSEKDNNIAELRKIYQPKPEGSKGKPGGASTLITRAGSEYHREQTKLGSIVITEDGKKYWANDPETGEKLKTPPGKKYYGIDPTTGEEIRVKTGKTYWKKSPTKKEPDRWVEVKTTETVTKMDHVKDARQLMSSLTDPNPTELAYADYANKMKALANRARKEYVETPHFKRDPKMTELYADEVKSLQNKVDNAKRNAPKERQAQILASVTYKKKLADNPGIEADADQLKRLKGQCLKGARDRIGAGKERVDITDREWEAIQKGAVSETLLGQVLANAKPDKVKKLATPKSSEEVNPAVIARIQSLAAQTRTVDGQRVTAHSIADIAENVGLSPTTVSKILSGKR